MKTKLLTLCSSLRVVPTIAYSTGSQKCKNLGQILSAELEELKKAYKAELKSEPAMLMIVDRNRDRLTPLRLPWSYQSMVHEHLIYQDGRVIYGGLAHKEANFEEAHDGFYRGIMFENFGKTINASSALLKEAAREQSASHASLNSLQGLEFIAERLPEIKKKVHLAQKHFEIVEYMSEIVKERKLLDMSKIEAEIIDTKLGAFTFDVD